MKIKIKILGLLLACITCLMQAIDDDSVNLTPDCSIESASGWDVVKMAEEYAKWRLKAYDEKVDGSADRTLMRNQLLVWLSDEIHTAKDLEYEVFKQRKLPRDTALFYLLEELASLKYALVKGEHLVAEEQLAKLQTCLLDSKKGYCSKREMFLKDNNNKTIAKVAFDWRNCKEETKEAVAKEIGVAIYNGHCDPLELEKNLLRFNDGKKFVLDLVDRIDTDKKKSLGFSLGVNYDRKKFDCPICCMQVSRSASFWKAIFYNASVLPQLLAGILFGNLAHDGFYKQSSCTKTRYALTTGIGLIIAGIGHGVKHEVSGNFLYADESTKSENLIEVERHMAPAGLFGFALGALGSMVAREIW